MQEELSAFADKFEDINASYEDTLEEFLSILGEKTNITFSAHENPRNIEGAFDLLMASIGSITERTLPTFGHGTIEQIELLIERGSGHPELEQLAKVKMIKPDRTKVFDYKKRAYMAAYCRVQAQQLREAA